MRRLPILRCEGLSAPSSLQWLPLAHFTLFWSNHSSLFATSWPGWSLGGVLADGCLQPACIGAASWSRHCCCSWVALLAGGEGEVGCRVSPNTHLEVSWLTTHRQGGGCKEEPVEVEGQGVQRGKGAARDCGEEAAERGGRGEECDQNHLQQRVPPSFRQDRDPDEPQPMGGHQYPILLPCHCFWGTNIIFLTCNK